MLREAFQQALQRRVRASIQQAIAFDYDIREFAEYVADFRVVVRNLAQYLRVAIAK